MQGGAFDASQASLPIGKYMNLSFSHPSLNSRVMRGHKKQVPFRLFGNLSEHNLLDTSIVL